MPELPEVETTLRGIAPHITQQTIKAVAIRERRLRWPIPNNMEQTLVGKIITDVQRRGKYLLLIAPPGAIIIHLGMSGNLRIITEPLPPKKHDHVDIVFCNDITLRFADPRRFGACLWTDGDPMTHPLLEHLGIEPLTAAFTGKYLLKHAQNKSATIKSFIMDNHVVTGIGNIYATEALFSSGIHPAAPAKSVSLEQLNQLVSAIKRILRHAIQRGGTTLKDFTNSDGKPGYFAFELHAYGREGLPCTICKTLLQHMRIGQRSTVYCPNCQA